MGSLGQDWMENELQYLRDHFHTCSASQLAKALPGRSNQAIIHKARRIGLVRSVDQQRSIMRRTANRSKLIIDDWSPLEDETLRTKINQMSYADLAKLLGRHVGLIKRRISILGLSRSAEGVKAIRQKTTQKRRDIWTVEQDQYLRENWATMSKTQIAKVVNRPPGAVSGRVSYLGLKKTAEQIEAINKSTRGSRSTWTPEQDQFLRDNYEKLSKADIAKALKKNCVATVLDRGKALGLTMSEESRRLIYENRKLKRPDYFWTPEQTQFLLDNYKSIPVRKIAQQLGKSQYYVSLKATRLGLQLSKEEWAAKRQDPDYLPDSNIARFITRDPDLAELVMNNPALIRLKRLQIALNKRMKRA